MPEPGLDAIGVLAQGQAVAPPESLAPAAVVAYLLADLAIILIAARLVGAVFVRIGQPRVVGEIIAGVLIGPTVLGGQLSKGAVTATGAPATAGSGLVDDLYPLQSFAVLSLLGTLTLVLFMFLVGLEVQQRFLAGRSRQILGVAAVVVLVPVALGVLVGAILDEPGTWKVERTPEGEPVSAATHALFLGAGLAVTAFPVMARILQEKRMLATAMGAVGVGAAAVVTPLMFLVLAGATASARGEGVPTAVGLKLVWALALVAVLFGVARPLLARLLDRRFRPGEPLDADLLVLLLVGALLTGLAADRIGINSLNGGFLFGACVPQVPGLARAVIDRVQTLVVVVLVPVFLAVSGLQTDLTVLRAEHVGGILLFLVAMVAGKWLAGALAGRGVGLGWQEANAIGVLMNCRGLMILVVALVGQQAGVITAPMQGVFVIGAIVTTLMTGPLVDVFLPSAAVERERSRIVSESLAALPAMTGGPRVVASIPDAAATARLAAVAAAVVDGREGVPQFLLAGLPRPPDDGGYVTTPLEEGGRAMSRTLDWLEVPRERLAANRWQVEVAAFESPAPAADLRRLAADWAATDAIVASDDEARALASAGIRVHRLA